MSRKKSRRQHHQNKQVKSRTQGGALHAMPGKPVAESGLDAEARNTNLEDKVITMAELRADALIARMQEDPNCAITATDINIVKAGLKITGERVKEEREAAQAEAEAEAEANAEPELDPHAAAIGEALLKGDSASAMQLIHKDGEWPENLDGLGVMAMAAMAESNASG